MGGEGTVAYRSWYCIPDIKDVQYAYVRIDNVFQEDGTILSLLYGLAKLVEIIRRIFAFPFTYFLVCVNFGRRNIFYKPYELLSRDNTGSNPVTIKGVSIFHYVHAIVTYTCLCFGRSSVRFRDVFLDRW